MGELLEARDQKAPMETGREKASVSIKTEASEYGMLN